MTTFPVPDHVILFGGSPLIIAVAKMLLLRDVRVDVYTSPRHEEEPVGPDGETLGELLSDVVGISVYVCTADINRDFDVTCVGAKTFGIGFGEAWQFSPTIIDTFGGRLLDFMGIPLPKYRGGAHYTWAILQQELMWGSCLQRVTATTVQGVHDDGEVIFRDMYTMSYGAVTPQDWFAECNRRDTLFIARFFDNVMAGVAFSPIPISEDESLYLPRLKTPEHGWIDWRWSGIEICDFINAFDDPYSGASTTLNGFPVQLRGVTFQDGRFHPFAAGLITNISNGTVSVIVSDGLLFIESVERDGKKITADVTVGSRFFTSQARLERALFYRPEYTATGDGAVL